MSDISSSMAAVFLIVVKLMRFAAAIEERGAESGCTMTFREKNAFANGGTWDEHFLHKMALSNYDRIATLILNLTPIHSIF